MNNTNSDGLFAAMKEIEFLKKQRVGIEKAISNEQEKIRVAAAKANEIHVNKDKKGCVEAFEDIKKFITASILERYFIPETLRPFKEGDEVIIVLGDERITRKISSTPRNNYDDFYFIYSPKEEQIGKINRYKKKIKDLEKEIETLSIEVDKLQKKMKPETDCDQGSW